MTLAVGVYLDGRRSVKRAKRQGLKVDEEILKDSIIRSLFREYSKQYRSGLPNVVESKDSTIRFCGKNSITIGNVTLEREIKLPKDTWEELFDEQLPKDFRDVGLMEEYSITRRKRMMKNYMVTYSVCGTMIIKANSAEEAREKALAMSSDEILEEVKVALEGDSYEVGTVEEYEE